MTKTEDYEWFHLWYPRIVKALGLNVENDKAATELASSLCNRVPTAERLARSLIKGKTCYVLGAGPSLPEAYSMQATPPSALVVAADGAARLLMEMGSAPPHILVTDLDGGDDVIGWCARQSVMCVHAHGDNIESLRRFLPCLVKLRAKILLTTQNRPVDGVKNYYGFTDGDRAAWLCHHFGARNIRLVGMDLGRRIGRLSKPAGSKIFLARKIKKLSIAQELLVRLSQEADICTVPKSPQLPGIRVCEE